MTKFFNISMMMVVVGSFVLVYKDLNTFNDAMNKINAPKSVQTQVILSMK